MPKYWMVSNRNVKRADLGIDHSSLSFWLTDSESVDEFTVWDRVTGPQFKKELVRAANGFPDVQDPAESGDQKHVSLFVHGYNNTWIDAARRYKTISKGLFSGPDGLGVCVLFTWPSDGLPTDCLPDRAAAEKSAPELADVIERTLRLAASAAGCGGERLRQHVQGEDVDDRP